MFLFGDLQRKYPRSLGSKCHGQQRKYIPKNSWVSYKRSVGGWTYWRVCYVRTRYLLYGQLSPKMDIDQVDIDDLIALGDNSRSVASTGMNQRSSRSHTISICIFLIIIFIQKKLFTHTFSFALYSMLYPFRKSMTSFTCSWSQLSKRQRTALRKLDVSTWLI